MPEPIPPADTPQPKVRFDEALKIAIQRYFQPMTQLLVPHLHQAIDWNIPPQFLDKELQQLTPHSNSHKRYADHLVQVQLLSGEQQLLLIHIEAQAQRDETFARRMWQYFYRIHDRFPQHKVVSLALLADNSPTWRPSEYKYEFLGTRQKFEFLVVKLKDFESRRSELEQSRNPFAVVWLACLEHWRTRGAMRLRVDAVMALYRQLLKSGYNKEDIRSLMGLLNYLLSLSSAGERLLARELEEVASEMPEIELIPWFERRAKEEGLTLGRKEGLQRGVEQGSTKEARLLLLEALRVKFGRAPRSLTTKFKGLDLETLRQLRRHAILAGSLDEFLTKYDETVN